MLVLVDWHHFTFLATKKRHRRLLGRPRRRRHETKDLKCRFESLVGNDVCSSRTFIQILLQCENCKPHARPVNYRIRTAFCPDRARAGRRPATSGEMTRTRLAERTGFEPAEGHIPFTDLANRRFRPLSHLSGRPPGCKQAKGIYSDAMGPWRQARFSPFRREIEP